MERKFRVALALHHDAVPASQRFFLGAHHFARQRPDWQVVWKNGTSRLSWAEALSARPDGIVGILNPDVEQTLLTRPHPPVVILNNQETSLPRVVADGREAARRATQHLLNLHLQHFAFVGHGVFYYSQARKAGFLDVLKSVGRDRDAALTEWGWERGFAARFRRWLLALPRPCGLLCADDLIGLRTVNACLKADLRVPDELAIMGIGDIETLCLESPVTLSSVEQHFKTVGYRGAAYLDDVMRGRRPPPQPVLVPPGEIIVRDSTRTFGIGDPLVRRAMNVIHAEHFEPLTVQSLLRQLGDVSQRLLNLRFRKSVGSSPHQEILHSRVMRAQRLLRSTRMPQQQIALTCGFYDAAQFSRHFHRISGKTPSQYRKDAEAQAHRQ